MVYLLWIFDVKNDLLDGHTFLGEKFFDVQLKIFLFKLFNVSQIEYKRVSQIINIHKILEYSTMKIVLISI